MIYLVVALSLLVGGIAGVFFFRLIAKMMRSNALPYVPALLGLFFGFGMVVIGYCFNFILGNENLNLLNLFILPVLLGVITTGLGLLMERLSSKSSKK